MSIAIQTRSTEETPRHLHPYVKPAEWYRLRSGDGPKANSLTVTAGDRQMSCELDRSGTTLIDGVWDWRLTLQGCDIGSSECWTQSSSITNRHSEYLSFQLPLHDGVSIERQVFVARQDGFVFLADAIKCSRPVNGEYQMYLPLASAVGWRGNSEFQEGELHGRRGNSAAVRSRSASRRGTSQSESRVRGTVGRVARVVPVSAPEWCTEPGGRLELDGDELRLSAPFQGDGTYAALFIDLDARRHHRPLTWRRLTVGQALEVVPRDAAVGYRVQIGRSQWLFYRSLNGAHTRTVLGQNFSSQFVVARFPTSGRGEKLLEVQ